MVDIIVIERGAVVPRSGFKLTLALVAGCLWLMAVALLIPYPEHIRRGILDLQGLGHEGLSYGLAQARLVGAAILLAVAHVLSSRAHGTAQVFFRDEYGMKERVAVPRLVLAVRVLTWAALLAPLIGAGVAEGMVSTTDCFRSCEPFPN